MKKSLLLMLLAIVSVVAFAQKQDPNEGLTFKYVYQGSELYYHIYSEGKAELTGEVFSANLRGEVVIPGEIKVKGRTYKVTSINNGDKMLFKYKNNITSIVVPSTIRRVRAGTFKHMSGLKKVTFYCNDISASAFGDCPNLKEVYLKAGGPDQFRDDDNPTKNLRVRIVR